MKKRILIADDDANFTMALAVRLEANEYDVLTASDGFEAFKLALRESPDLIILDMWMPVGVGLSVAERLNEHGLGIPIIFLTGCKEAELHAASREVGAVGFIEKPYDPKQLLATVKQALSRSAETVNR